MVWDMYVIQVPNPFYTPHVTAGGPAAHAISAPPHQHQQSVQVIEKKYLASLTSPLAIVHRRGELLPTRQVPPHMHCLAGAHRTQHLGLFNASSGYHSHNKLFRTFQGSAMLNFHATLVAASTIAVPTCSVDNWPPDSTGPIHARQAYVSTIAETWSPYCSCHECIHVRMSWAGPSSSQVLAVAPHKHYLVLWLLNLQGTLLLVSHLVPQLGWWLLMHEGVAPRHIHA
jgi:hypothetical protein